MKQNLKTIILVGPPASGKTTWSHNYVAKNPNTVIVSRDAFRFMLRNSPVTEHKIEELINSLQATTIISALSSKLDVIVDNTHLKIKYINEVIDLVKYHSDIEFMVFDVSKRKCLERDEARIKKVGEQVLSRMFSDYEIIKNSFVFQPLKRVHKIHDYANKSGLEEIVIFDIDGTVAHSNGKRFPYDWDRVGIDDSDAVVIDMFRMHMHRGDRIFLLTGRDGVCRAETAKWFEERGLVYDKLLMKGVNDNRRDTVVKTELYNNEILGKYHVKVIYEDRQKIVDMWRKMGLKVFQVEPGLI